MEEVADELGLEGRRVGLGLGEREGTPGEANEEKASGTGGSAARSEPDGCWP